MSNSRAASQARIFGSALAALIFASSLPGGNSSGQGLSTFKLVDAPRTLAAMSNGMANVIVSLAPPALAFQKGRLDSREFRSSLRLQIQREQKTVFDSLKPANVKIGRRFENLAAFSAVVNSNGLAALQSNPQVALIEPVRELEPHLAQGIPLIHATTVRTNYNGAGVAIAICDTGVDYDHNYLGGGGFPNSKVIGGYDFGDGDADPAPNGQAHGTACAGIAAGNLGYVGDYIGGVAYNAKIYALKISAGTNVTASTADMIAAWDWCVTHKDDDTNNPILIVSTSFGLPTGLGGQRFLSACDSESPAMTAAAENAVAAGITLFTSSGNEGFCDSISWPACITSVIAVGAVYDTNFGTAYPCVSAASCAAKTPDAGCPMGYHATDDTAADKVTAYSNVSQILSLFAPADECYTLDISGTNGTTSGDFNPAFGGTSAACAYAAGAAACLQQAAKEITGNYLTPQQVAKLLVDFGDAVTDTKVPVTKPRVNLERAVENLSTNPVLAFVSTAISGGNGNLNLDTNECADLAIVLRNDGFRGATNVSAVLSALTPGVNIIESNANYPDMAVGGTATNATGFVVSTGPAYKFGTLPKFKLVLRYDGGSFTNCIILGPGEYAVTSDSAQIVPGTVDAGNHGDDVVTSLALPFGFTFYDQTFSNALLSTDGNLQFRSADGSAPNGCLPHTGFDYAILPYWADLRTDTIDAGIFTSVSGAAPDRIFNIEWRANNFSGEIRLYENQSRFDIVYGDMNGDGSGATIGAQKDTGSAFTQVGCGQSVVSNGVRFIFQAAPVNGGGQCGAPFLDFAGGPTNGVLPLEVSFTNLSVAATNFVWDFGDGQFSTNANPMHVYTNAGEYTVSLSAHNATATNWFSRAEFVVVTNPPPIADFIAGPTNGVAPMAVSFTNLSQFGTNFLWDFGNGDLSAETNPVEVFASPGTYSVTLTATGTGGTTPMTRDSYIVVLSPPYLYVTPYGADFGLVETGMQSEVVFQIFNAGEGDLHAAASVDGGPFSVLNESSNAFASLPFVVPGLASTNVVVRFAPLWPNAFTNAVLFLSDGGNSTNEISGRSIGTLLIASPGVDGTNFVFSFSTVPGVSYSVEFKGDLADSYWQWLETVEGDGQPVNVTNSVPDASQRFFRITAQ